MSGPKVAELTACQEELSLLGLALEAQCLAGGRAGAYGRGPVSSLGCLLPPCPWGSLLVSGFVAELSQCPYQAPEEASIPGDKSVPSQSSQPRWVAAGLRREGGREGRLGTGGWNPWGSLPWGPQSFIGSGTARRLAPSRSGAGPGEPSSEPEPWAGCLAAQPRHTLPGQRQPLPLVLEPSHSQYFFC